MSKLAVLAIACASCAATPPPSPPPPHPPAPPASGLSSTMIYIDALIIEVEPGRLVATMDKTADELANTPGMTIRAHPMALVMNHERSTVTLGCDPPTTCSYYALAFVPDIVNDDAVRLDAEIHGDVFGHANTVLRKGQMFEIETTPPVAPAVPNSTVLIQLRADVVHNIAELNRLHPSTN